MNGTNIERQSGKGGRRKGGAGDESDELAVGRDRKGTSKEMAAGGSAERRAISGRGRGLGWFSIGLGAAQLLAPRRVSQLIGLDDDERETFMMRAVGVREVLAGVGILTRGRPGWFWSRVAGDVMDLALLGNALRSARTMNGRVPFAIAAVAGITIVDVLASRRVGQRAQAADAAAAKPVSIEALITINRSPEDVYTFWRDFRNLPRFMTFLESVQVRDQLQSHWKAAASAGTSIEWDAIVTEDRPSELIAWKTQEPAEPTLKNIGSIADLITSGEVRFSRAPGGRGTEVRLKMRLEPPKGLRAAGEAVTKLLRQLPEEKMDNDLRRFKQLMEVGEVVRSDASVHTGPHPAQPSGLTV